MDCALYSAGRRRHRIDDLRTALREAEKEDGFVWIGLVEPTADEFDPLAEGFELPELAIEDAIRAHQRPKLERYGGVTFAVVKPVHYVDHVEVVEVSELAIFLGDRFVIVVRHGDTTIPALVRTALEADPEMLLHGPPAVLHGILDKAVDQYLDVTAAIDEDLDEIEDQVFGDDPGSDHAERIYKLKREVQQFRRAVVPLVAAAHPARRGRGALHPGLRAAVLPRRPGPRAARRGAHRGRRRAAHRRHAGRPRAGDRRAEPRDGPAELRHAQDLGVGGDRAGADRHRRALRHELRPHARPCTPAFGFWVVLAGIGAICVGPATARSGATAGSRPRAPVSISSTISGASGSVVGRNRCTDPSGVTTNFSKFHVTRPALPDASGVLVSSA